MNASQRKVLLFYGLSLLQTYEHYFRFVRHRDWHVFLHQHLGTYIHTAGNLRVADMQ